jgi:hypothetical protein
LGACRYCGQALPDQSATLQGLATGFGPGNTSPTLPKQDQPPALTNWNDTTNNAKTQFGPLSFAQPNAPEPGTAPFAANAPAGPAPAGNIPPPGAYSAPSAPPPIYYPPDKRARKGGGKILALAIIIIVVLVAAIGGGLLFARGFNKPSASSGTTVTAGSPNPSASATPRANATPTATATPTPTPTPTLSSTYNDPNGLFSIRFPGGWTHEDTSPAGANVPLPLNGVRFHSGDAELVVLTGQEVPGLPTDGLAEQANAALLATMNAQNSSSPTSRQIDGKTWTAQNADTDGGKHTVIASISFNGHLYTLWYSAPANEFSTDEQRDFNPMVASFTFGA